MPTLIRIKMTTKAVDVDVGSNSIVSVALNGEMCPDAVLMRMLTVKLAAVLIV